MTLSWGRHQYVEFAFDKRSRLGFVFIGMRCVSSVVSLNASWWITPSFPGAGSEVGDNESYLGFSAGTAIVS